MSEKRFTIEKEAGLYRIFDNGEIIPILDGQPIVDLLNEVVDEKCRLEKDLDACVEQISKLHLRISDLAIELENKSKEHYENDFKLHTLEKWYTCPDCAFNRSEFQYLKSLRK